MYISCVGINKATWGYHFRKMSLLEHKLLVFASANATWTSSCVPSHNQDKLQFNHFNKTLFKSSELMNSNVLGHRHILSASIGNFRIKRASSTEHSAEISGKSPVAFCVLKKKSQWPRNVPLPNLVWYLSWVGMKRLIRGQQNCNYVWLMGKGKPKSCHFLYHRDVDPAWSSSFSETITLQII